MYINWKRKELTITLALYGPAGSGKTTSWRYWANAANLPLPQDDTFSLRLDNIQGKQLIVNIRDITGAETSAATRRVALYGVDGLIFVADSHPAQKKANQQSLVELQANLQAMKKSIHRVPMLLQYNKRDLPNALPVASLQEALNPHQAWPYQTTSVIREEGLVETLKQTTDLILRTVLHGHALTGGLKLS